MGAGFQRYFELNSSRYLLWLLSASCLVLSLTLYSLPYALVLRNLAVIFVVAVTVFAGLRDARLSLAKSCVAFSFEGKNNITLIQRNGQHLVGKISAGSLVVPFLVLINISITEREKRSIVLLPDSMSREAFRHLRVQLRWDQ